MAKSRTRRTKYARAIELIRESATVTRDNCIADWIKNISDHVEGMGVELENFPPDIDRDNYLPMAAQNTRNIIKIALAFAPLYPEPIRSRAMQLLGRVLQELIPLANGEPGRLRRLSNPDTDLYECHISEARTISDKYVEDIRLLAGAFIAHDDLYGMPDPPACLPKGKITVAEIAAAVADLRVPAIPTSGDWSIPLDLGIIVARLDIDLAHPRFDRIKPKLNAIGSDIRPADGKYQVRLDTMPESYRNNF